VRNLARVFDAVASAIFRQLAAGMGLPTATDVQALRADLKVREELRTIRDQLSEGESDSADHDMRRGGDSANTSAERSGTATGPSPNAWPAREEKSVAP